MTTREIADAVGKPIRTVQDWVKELSAKSALISAKSASSSPRTIPARRRNNLERLPGNLYRRQDNLHGDKAPPGRTGQKGVMLTTGHACGKVEFKDRAC